MDRRDPQTRPMSTLAELATFTYHDVTDDPGDSGFQRPAAMPYKLSTAAFQGHLDAIGSAGSPRLAPVWARAARPPCAPALAPGGAARPVRALAPRADGRPRPRLGRIAMPSAARAAVTVRGGAGRRFGGGS